MPRCIRMQCCGGRGPHQYDRGMSSPRDLAAIPSPALEGTALTVVVPVVLSNNTDRTCLSIPTLGSREQSHRLCPTSSWPRPSNTGRAANTKGLPARFRSVPRLWKPSSSNTEGRRSDGRSGCCSSTATAEMVPHWPKRWHFCGMRGVMLLGCRALFRVPTPMPDTLKRAYCCTFRPIWCT